MILERLHYIPMGWWRWAKVRMTLFGYRLSGGFKKRNRSSSSFSNSQHSSGISRFEAKNNGPVSDLKN